MKNRSVILGLIFLFAGSAAVAQKGELSTAKSSFDSYDAMKIGNVKLAYPALDKAKVSIDKAVANEKTSVDPETWAYKALIYAGLADRDTTETGLPMIKETIDAVAKTRELDTKATQKANLDKVSDMLYRVFINRAVRQYQAAKYSESYTTFTTAASYAGPGRDTTATYYAAISAQNAKDYNTAIKEYSKLLTTNYSYLEDVYSNLSILYALNKDTVTAIKLASEGMKRYPKNSQLAQREIEFSLMTHHEKETIDKLTAQAAKEPTNRLWPYYLGIAYSATKDYKSAEDAYKKAVTIDPTYADAMINLSGIIINGGIDIYRTASALPTNKQAEYNDGIKKANVEFDRALPYLLKATELDPKSLLAWRNLKAYYDIKNDKVKSDDVKKKIDALK